MSDHVMEALYGDHVMEVLYDNQDGLITHVTDDGDEDVRRGTLYFIVVNGVKLKLQFQDGPIAKSGVNGITTEQLLIVLVHRLKALNKKIPCRQNALAITKLEEAFMWLNHRTAERTARGVEGTNKQ